MTITTVTSRKILPTTLAAALAGLLMVSGCTKQTNEEANTTADTQTEVENTESTTNTELSAADKAHTDRLAISYANMAHAAYKDSLETAKTLQTAVEKYVATPTQENLEAARAAYKAARQPYSQTEIFRFDEGFVTANDKRQIGSVDGWEGQVNAWPLDEALIDYVNDSYQGEYNSKDNIINSDSITVGSIKQDTSTITPELLAEMNEIGGSEANVTTGYHAIEFMLWGQDVNGVAEGAGNRPVTDYVTETGQCTSGDTANDDASICERRGEFLKAAAQLLVDDLTAMEAEWQPGSEDTLRSDLMARKYDNGLRQIMYQMGSLALGELASERMQVAFVTGSTEDEHECFSDLTHLSYANNARGIQNVFNGSYKTVAGKSVGGYGVKHYLVDTDNKDAADKLAADFKKVENAFNTIVEKGEKDGIKVDQMIATVGQASKEGISAEEQNKRRGWIEAGINSLQELTSGIENAAKAVGIDNLDADAGSQF
ncbi:imelysin family protein [Psychrobacter sp. AOP22-C1-22]|uniref:imelysin family protein n=1 Tax=unclassified Psychrobacter TaxID=196806 RepID=UPI00178809BC|nr:MULTISPECIES: imelysin family protein [unclassified Psychrobacter]MBE0406990.1 imelysin [Psychrobacter sp. FME6]MBE0445824.1 imelysin [Psychrobacter sp. FME5]MDN5801044.1 imelysin [Psychrobacter sp.]